MKNIFLFTLLFLSIYFIPMSLLTYNTDLVTLEKEGHYITVQGMIHTAPEEFYKETLSNIELYKLYKYKYYYEKVIIEDEENLKKWKAKTGDTSFFIDGIVDVLDLSGQNQYKEISVGIRADVKMKDIIDIIEKEKIEIVSKENLKDIKDMTETIKKYDYFSFAKDSWIQKQILTAVMRYSFRTVEMIGGRPEFEDVIVYRRNDVLLNTIDYDQNAFITYGQLHVKDIVKKLKAKGYKVIEKEKVKVF